MSRIEKKIIFLNEVESTNNYANQMILSKASVEGTVVMAQFQKTGRGQLGNHWESEQGKNLLASIILTPNYLKAGKQFLLSKMVSLSIVEFLQKEIEDVSIKWPNDIYVGDKKIAGILIENSIKGDKLFSSVVGVGLNLNQEKFLSYAPNPVSMKLLTGMEYKVESVAYELFENIIDKYQKLEFTNHSEIDLAYFSQLYGKEEWRYYSKEGVRFEAKIVGIGEFGQLLLENRSGSIEEFMFKEVEFIISP